MKSKFTLLVSFCLTSFAAFSQVIVPEEVKTSCSGLEISDRVRLAVARFSQTSARNYGSRNIDNFSTMLSNALFEIDCFRMLSVIQDNNYTYTGKEKRDILPHFIITGEITEFSHKKEESNAILVKKTIIRAHLGFVLQIKDPISREIIFSKSFNQDGSSENKELQLKVTGRPVQSTSDVSIDNAYDDAIEKGILEAVTYIVSNREKIYSYANLVMSDAAKSSSQFEVVVNNATFGFMSEIENVIKTRCAATQIDKHLDHGTGQLTFNSTSSLDAIAEALNAQFSNRITITGFDGPKLTIKLN